MVIIFVQIAEETMTLRNIIILIAINLLYAGVSVFTKYASAGDFLSLQYILSIVGAVVVLGLYAICWQQVLKRISLSTAYMFKGTTVIFILLFSVLLFGESITLWNIIGSIIIISGITLYAKEDEK